MTDNAKEKDDAPTSDAPTSDAPTSDAPTSDAPATDTPTSDAPTNDAPATDTPHADSKRDGARAAGATKDEATSWGFPGFAKEFPENAELSRLVEAFARGDYRTVRMGAPKLAASTDDEAVKKAAQTLRKRIEPDPTSKLLFVFAAALLAFLTLWWVSHDGPEGNVAPLKPAPVERVKSAP